MDRKWGEKHLWRSVITSWILTAAEGKSSGAGLCGAFRSGACWSSSTPTLTPALLRSVALCYQLTLLDVWLKQKQKRIEGRPPALSLFFLAFWVLSSLHLFAEFRDGSSSLNTNTNTQKADRKKCSSMERPQRTCGCLVMPGLEMLTHRGCLKGCSTTSQFLGLWPSLLLPPLVLVNSFPPPTPGFHPDADLLSTKTVSN